VAGYIKMIYPETVTHPSINQARRNYVYRDQRATLSQATTSVYRY